MESSVFLSDLLTAHEPLSIVSFISNELRVRFMRRAPTTFPSRIGTVNGRARLRRAPISITAEIRARRSLAPIRFLDSPFLLRTGYSRPNPVPDHRTKTEDLYSLP